MVALEFLVVLLAESNALWVIPIVASALAKYHLLIVVLSLAYAIEFALSIIGRLQSVAFTLMIGFI